MSLTYHSQLTVFKNFSPTICVAVTAQHTLHSNTSPFITKSIFRYYLSVLLKVGAARLGYPNYSEIISNPLKLLNLTGRKVINSFHQVRLWRTVLQAEPTNQYAIDKSQPNYSRFSVVPQAYLVSPQNV